MIHYRPGEIVLLQWHGWLKAFRVIGAQVFDDQTVEYRMEMVEDKPEWTKPG